MTLTVTRSNIRLNPDYKKVIPRYFNTGNERSLLIIAKVIQMEDKDAQTLLGNTMIEFSNRYRNIQSIFLKHFNLTKHLLPDREQHDLSEEKKLLIGSYFTMEYSIEAAALFNPSIMEDSDQYGAGAGQKKVIVSFRATGESHISSLVFRQGLLDENGMIHLEPAGRFFGEGVVAQQDRDNKMVFATLLSQMVLPDDIISHILDQLKDPFSYKEIEVVLKDALLQIESVAERKKIRYEILSMVNTNYELNFLPDSLLSERVIFPVTRAEKNGIEDARFVKFTEDDGTFTYIATYT
ncbi:MAG: glycosidase, partial [Segetibacter sp.]|nr:glycosidase [Segetibacter sp.]